MSPPNPIELKAAKLVLAAIDDLQGSEGLTLETIISHIENEFSVPNKEFGKHLARVINKGVAFGAIKRQKGRYYLGEVMDKIRAHRRRRRKSKNGKGKNSKRGKSKGGRRRRRKKHY